MFISIFNNKKNKMYQLKPLFMIIPRYHNNSMVLTSMQFYFDLVAIHFFQIFLLQQNNVELFNIQNSAGQGQFLVFAECFCTSFPMIVLVKKTCRRLKLSIYRNNRGVCRIRCNLYVGWREQNIIFFCFFVLLIYL